MRRATAVLAACLCAITGCRGGAAQEPYDGVVVSSRTPAAVPLPAMPADETEPIASEVDIPWTIALLSDGARRPEPRRHVSVVNGDPHVEVEVDIEVPVIDVSVDLQLAVDHSTDPKPAAIKVCPGVVKRRS